MLTKTQVLNYVKGKGEVAIETATPIPPADRGVALGPKACVDCGTIINNWPVDVPAICDRCLEERRLW
jgi:predicted Zn-ribbon and HTH transcriptional regulator